MIKRRKPQVRLPHSDLSVLQRLVVLATFLLLVACDNSGGSGSANGSGSDGQDENDGCEPTLAGVVYVATALDGGDDGNVGTSDSPKLTISEAISVASECGASQVRVAEGTYNVTYPVTHIVVREGVSLFGGYPVDWSDRDPSAFPTTIADTSSSGGAEESSPNRAVEAGSAVTSLTVVDGFRILGGGGDYSAGLLIIDGAAPIIRNNYIHGGSGSAWSQGIRSADSQPTIESNTIHGGSGGSISMAIRNPNSSPMIFNNVIYGGDSQNTYGVSAEPQSTPTIRNNTISGGSGSSFAYGIHFGTSSSPTIENNIVFTSASAGGRICVIEANASGDAASLRNNDLHDCPTSLYSDQDTGLAMQGVDGSGNLTQNSDGTGTALATPTGVGNVSADPVLADASGGDWHLTGASPSSVTMGGLNGIDEVWGFDDDTEDLERPASGSPWAMGAYEP